MSADWRVVLQTLREKAIVRGVGYGTWCAVLTTAMALPGGRRDRQADRGCVSMCAVRCRHGVSVPVRCAVLKQGFLGCVFCGTAMDSVSMSNL
eukprot:2502577-Rhodomonas_salina.1